MDKSIQPIITIDGPVGSGKSTIGRLLAKRLGLIYLDTGAMYRVIALQVSERGLDPGNEQSVAACCASARIGFRQCPDRQLVFSGDRDVTDCIRTPEISMLASRISALPAVREALVDMQRRIGRSGGIVVDGRDAGTVIFPQARYKFYLDAGAEVRARRRYKEFIEKNMQIDYNSLFQDLQKRDHDDSSRSIAPLKPAHDAVVIDSSTMTIEDVLEAIATRIAVQAPSLP